MTGFRNTDPVCESILHPSILSSPLPLAQFGSRAGFLGTACRRRRRSFQQFRRVEVAQCGHRHQASNGASRRGLRQLALDRTEFPRVAQAAKMVMSMRFDIAVAVEITRSRRARTRRLPFPRSVPCRSSGDPLSIRCGRVVEEARMAGHVHHYSRGHARL